MIERKQVFSAALAALVSVVMVLSSAAQAATETEQIRYRQISEGLNKFAPYKVSVTQFYFQNGKFPTSNSQLHIPPAEKFRDEFITGLKIEGEGIISVNYVNFPDVANAWIHLIPDFNQTHAMHWRCVSNIPDIDKTAPDCHFYRATSESEAGILQEAKVKQVKKTDSQAAAFKSPGKEMDCAALKQNIEDKLQSKGLKNYQVTILGKSDAATGKIVGQCNKGANKIEYRQLRSSAVVL